MGRYTLCHGPVDDETFIEHYLEQDEALRVEYQMLLLSLREARACDLTVGYKFRDVVWHCAKCNQLQVSRSKCNICRSSDYIEEVGDL